MPAGSARKNSDKTADAPRRQEPSQSKRSSGKGTPPVDPMTKTQGAMPLLNSGQTARLEQLGGLRTTKHSLKQGSSTLQGDATFLNARLQTF